MVYKKLYYYFQSALSNYLCDKIIHEGFANNVHSGGTGGFIPRNDSEKKEKKELRDSNISWIGDWWLKKEILPYVERANKKAGWNFNLVDSEPCQFTIYDNKQHYWWHRDAKRYPYYNNHFPNLIRKLSVTVSLSHPEEYEGGYLQMAARQEWSDTHLCQVTEILPRGSICVFPSYTWHRVSPVTKGRRLSLVQWNLGEGYV
jgi:PKHD-type hydroxylase